MPNHEGMLVPTNANMLAMKIAAKKAEMLRGVAGARKKYRRRHCSWT
jgi:hypothetical protein